MIDTCVYIDLARIDTATLPLEVELTAVSVAELAQGVELASNPAIRAARSEMLTSALRDFDPLPFDTEAAVRFQTLVALVVAAGRHPRPRRLDLMVAAIASIRDLPLFTSNPDDFAGLDSAVDIVPVIVAAE